MMRFDALPPFRATAPIRWRVLLSPVLCLLMWGRAAFSQATVTAPLPQSSYLIPVFPSRILGLLGVFGDRLQKPGNERVTLAGALTVGSAVNSATVVTEIPGKVHIVISGSQAKTLNFVPGATALSNGAAAIDADLDMLESLQSDAAEAFFYAFPKGFAVRSLGTRYRTDDGKSKTYVGPYYSIYQMLQAVPVRPGNPIQQKLFYFDSTTGLFVKARYLLERKGQMVEVQTVFSGWQRSGSGQAVPSHIERLEDGKTVFSFSASAVQVSAASNDGTFPTP